jgi:hypothetical protein
MADILSTTDKRLPAPIKSNLKFLAEKLFANRGDLHKIFLARLGIATDFSGYEPLLNYIEANKIYELKGDFLEIGAFMGGGTAKLASMPTNIIRE